MKSIYLTFSILLLTSLQTAAAGPINPLNVTYLDVTLNGFPCYTTAPASPGIHLEINHNTGIVRGRGTGCLSDAANLNLLGTVGNLDKFGASVSILIPGTGQLLIIDDNPKKWYAYYQCCTPLTSSGDYLLGAPY